MHVFLTEFHPDLVYSDRTLPYLFLSLVTIVRIFAVNNTDESSSQAKQQMMPYRFIRATIRRLNVGI